MEMDILDSLLKKKNFWFSYESHESFMWKLDNVTTGTPNTKIITEFTVTFGAFDGV